MEETPETIHGRLLEAVHFSGYSFERACKELEWLLEEDKWKTIGKGFEDIDAFLSTIDFSHYKIAIDQRKQLAKKLSDLRATQRATGKMLGVTEVTVARDLGKSRGATNVAKTGSEALPIDAEADVASTNVAPPPTAITQTGAEAAAFAEKAGKKTDTAKETIKRLTDQYETLQKEKVVIQLQPRKTYKTIIIDPPWPIKKILREERPKQAEFDYPKMTVEEIMALPIQAISDEKCHLYLWTTQKYIPYAIDIVVAWGFQYQCLMTWVKNVGFTPFSWMYSTEHVVFATRGGLKLLQNGLRLDFSGKVREHSRKPDEFFERVAEASPEPRIDYFSREQRQGFEQFGNEQNKFSG